MGTTLEGKQINQTYQSLLKTTDNGEIGASNKEITDGKGNGTGISLNNSGNLTATGNVTANTFIGNGSQLTNLPVTSVNTQTGNVVLTADNISDADTSNKFTSASDISKLANIEANADVTDIANVTTALNSISATELSDITNVGSGSIITSIERTKLDGIENNAQVNPTDAEIKASYESNTNTNAFTDALKSKLQNIEAGAEVNNINSVNGQVGTVSLGLLDLTNVGADGSSGEVLTTDGLGNFTFQAAGGGEGLVTRVNGATGNVTLDTDDIGEGTTNKYYTDARVAANSAVAANTAKVGITTQQASDIQTNNAKVGITTEQANAITANTSKVGITTEQANAIVANTAKNSYPTADATKVGHISVTQAVDLDTLESDVTTNNAKVSFDSASSTKLAGIEAGAEVNVNADWNATTGDAQILNKPTLATVATTGAYSDLSGTPSLATVATTGSYNDLSDQPTIPTNNNQLTNGAGYITDGNTNWDNTYGFITASSTDTLTNKSGNNSQWTNDAGYINLSAQTTHTNAIGNAIDFSARVTLAGGVAEGTSGIIKNLQSIL